MIIYNILFDDTYLLEKQVNNFNLEKHLHIQGFPKNHIQQYSHYFQYHIIIHAFFF